MADAVQGQQLGVPDLIHQAYSYLMDNALDLGCCGQEDVVLGLDEKQERYDEERR